MAQGEVEVEGSSAAADAAAGSGTWRKVAKPADSTTLSNSKHTWPSSASMASRVMLHASMTQPCRMWALGSRLGCLKAGAAFSPHGTPLDQAHCLSWHAATGMQDGTTHLSSPSQVEPRECTWKIFSPKRATGLVGGTGLGAGATMSTWATSLSPAQVGGEAMAASMGAWAQCWQHSC